MGSFSGGFVGALYINASLTINTCIFAGN